MPLGAIRPGDPSWRKASRYVRIGRDDLRALQHQRDQFQRPSVNQVTAQVKSSQSSD
jgi:hypothetical protein